MLFKLGNDSQDTLVSVRSEDVDLVAYQAGFTEIRTKSGNKIMLSDPDKETYRMIMRKLDSESRDE